MIIRILLCLTFVCSSMNALWGQQMLVEKGVSEFYIGGAAGIGNGNSATAGEVGIGIDGIVGLNAGFSSMHDNSVATRVAFVVASIAVHGRNGKLPSLLGMRAGYLKGEESDAFDFGFGILVAPRGTRTLILTLGGSADLLFPITDSRYRYRSRTSLQTAIGFTAGARLGISRNVYCFVGPAVAIAQNNTIFSLGAGFGIRGSTSSRFANKPDGE